MRFDDTEGFMLKCIQLQRGQAMFPNVCEKSANIVGIDILHDKNGKSVKPSEGIY